MSTFSVDVSNWVKKVRGRGDTIMRRLAMEAYLGVIKNSPVDTGRFRGNWNIGINGPDLSTTGETNPAPPHSAGVAPQAAPTPEELQRMAGKAPSIKWQSTVWITNNLEYAVPLENGHSKQAPGTGAVMRRAFEVMKNNFTQTLQSIP